MGNFFDNMEKELKKDQKTAAHFLLWKTSPEYRNTIYLALLKWLCKVSAWMVFFIIIIHFLMKYW